MIDQVNRIIRNKCNVCNELVNELGTCGDCRHERVCPECWQAQECCAIMRRNPEEE